MKVATYISVAVLCLCISHSSCAKEFLRSSLQNSIPKYVNENSGLCVDIIYEFNQRSKKYGVVIERSESEFISLKRALSQLQNHQIDIFCGLSKSVSRKQYISYIDVPLYDVEEVFVKRRFDPFQYSGVASLKGKSIVVIQGTQTANKMLLLPQIKLYQVKSVEQMLKMVEVGRADLAFYHSLGINYQLSQLGKKELLALVDKSYSTKSHYMVVSQQVSLLTQQKIAIVLNNMANDGTLVNILSKYQQVNDKP